MSTLKQKNWINLGKFIKITTVIVEHSLSFVKVYHDLNKSK
jgi:hypothetical protein